MLLKKINSQNKKEQQKAREDLTKSHPIIPRLSPRLAVARRTE